MNFSPNIYRSAEFSEDGEYRYSLERSWGPGLFAREGSNHVIWIMLNPSVGDGLRDDPTIVRCMEYTNAWGYTRMSIINLFGYISTDPKVLKTLEDPVGPENNLFWEKVLGLSGKVPLIICAWGVSGSYLDQDEDSLIWLVHEHKLPLFALRVNKSGSPCHPLRLPASLIPQPYSYTKKGIDGWTV